MFRTIERYEENGLGLPYPVVLINAAEEEVDDTGTAVGIHIPGMEELVAAIAVTRCLSPFRLVGPEVKFIRKAIGMPAKQLAEGLEMDPATFSRWENGKQALGAWADKQLRTAALLLLKDKVPHISLDPKEIVGLHFVPGKMADQPPLEMVLVKPESDCEPDGCWDTNFRMAA